MSTTALLVHNLFVNPQARRVAVQSYFTKIHQISVHATYGRGSVLLWRPCDTLCTSGFVDDVTFAHNGSYGAVNASRA